METSQLCKWIDSTLVHEPRMVHAQVPSWGQEKMVVVVGSWPPLHTMDETVLSYANHKTLRIVGYEVKFTTNWLFSSKLKVRKPAFWGPKSQNFKKTKVFAEDRWNLLFCYVCYHKGWENLEYHILHIFQSGEILKNVNQHSGGQ